MAFSGRHRYTAKSIPGLPDIKIGPNTSRFANSHHFKKTNFAFGDDKLQFESTYLGDFTTDPSSMKLPSTHLTAVLPTKPNVTLPQSKNKMNFQKERKQQLQKTNFIFGDDDTRGAQSAYQEQTVPAKTTTILDRRRPVSPPKTAQVLPPCPANRDAVRSTLQEDFHYCGHNIHNDVYGGRLGTLTAISDINVHDSVARTLLGPRRRMLTRTMVDYRHPLDRVHGNIKQLMTQQVSPAVRQDSIWRSVNEGGGRSNPITEVRQNFSWPMAEKGMKRFYRGQLDSIR